MDHVSDADPVGDGAGIEHFEGAVGGDAGGSSFDGAGWRVHADGAADGVEVVAVGGFGFGVVAEPVEFGEERFKEFARGDGVAESRGPVGRPADVDATADDHGAVRVGLGEHAGRFASLAVVAHEQQVVRPFESSVRSGGGDDSAHEGEAGAMGEGDGRVGHLSVEDGYKQVGARWGVPSTVESAASSGLVVGAQHGAVGGSVGGRCGEVGVGASGLVDLPQPPSTLGEVRRRVDWNGLRMWWQVHATYIVIRAVEDPDR